LDLIPATDRLVHAGGGGSHTCGVLGGAFGVAIAVGILDILRIGIGPTVAVGGLTAARIDVTTELIEEHVAPVQTVRDDATDVHIAETSIDALHRRFELGRTDRVLVVLGGQRDTVLLRLAARVVEGRAVEVAADRRHLEVIRLRVGDTDVDRERIVLEQAVEVQHAAPIERVTGDGLGVGVFVRHHVDIVGHVQDVAVARVHLGANALGLHLVVAPTESRDERIVPEEALVRTGEGGGLLLGHFGLREHLQVLTTVATHQRVLGVVRPADHVGRVGFLRQRTGGVVRIEDIEEGRAGRDGPRIVIDAEVHRRGRIEDPNRRVLELNARVDAWDVGTRRGIEVRDGVAEVDDRRRRAVCEGPGHAAVGVPVAVPCLAIGIHLPTTILREVLVFGCDTVEAMFAEQLDEELVVGEVGGAQFRKERSTHVLTVGVGPAASATTVAVSGHEGATEVRVGDAAAVGGQVVIIEVLGDIDRDGRSPAEQRFAAGLVALAIIDQVEADTVIPAGLRHVDVVGGPALEFRLVVTVDQGAVEVEDRRIGERLIAVATELGQR